MLRHDKSDRYLVRMSLGVALGALASVALAASHVPSTMEAVVQTGTGGPEVLKLQHVPVPRPADGQVLVHIYAAGVNPVDWKMRSGAFGPPRPPGPPGAAAGGPPGAAAGGPPGGGLRIPGAEFAGVVVALGSNVTQWKVGDAVYGSGTSMGSGGYAQFTLANADALGAKPKSITYAQAAGIPTAAGTALAAVKQAGAAPGRTVVIVGAAGGVGSATVQLAKADGARVITVASSRHNAYLKKLGADELVNYDKENPADKIKDADVVINLVDGSASAVIGYVKRGGLVVLPAGMVDQAQCASAGVTCGPLSRAGAPGPAEGYAAVNRLIDAGQYTLKVEKTFPLSQAGAAQELDRAGHAEGKIILVTTPAAEKR